MGNKKNEAVTVKRFVVSQGKLGKGLRLRFTTKKGETFEYDHDQVVEAAKDKLEALNCWARYKNYTSSSSIPGFAKEHATLIEESK